MKWKKTLNPLSFYLQCKYSIYFYFFLNKYVSHRLMHVLWERWVWNLKYSTVYTAFIQYKAIFQIHLIPYIDMIVFDLQEQHTPLLSQTCLLCTQGFAVFHYKTKWIALIFRTLLAPQQEVLGILMSSYCQHSTLTLTSQTADKVVHSRPL